MLEIFLKNIRRSFLIRALLRAADKDSQVLFELLAHPLGTHLRLVHDTHLRLVHELSVDADTTEFAAGWHWHLDGLDDAAKGIATLWDDRRWRALQVVYRMTL